MKHARFLAKINENNRAILYRCRWSQDDAKQVVTRLVEILTSDNHLHVNEALRALFFIGAPAEIAAIHVISHLASQQPLTRELAILALGQIAHKRPDLCLGPTMSAMDDDSCRSHAIRILAFLKGNAKPAIPTLVKHFEIGNAKTRKAIIKALVEIDHQASATLDLLLFAKADKNSTVRLAAEAAMSRQK